MSPVESPVRRPLVLERAFELELRSFRNWMGLHLLSMVDNVRSSGDCHGRHVPLAGSLQAIDEIRLAIVSHLIRCRYRT